MRTEAMQNLQVLRRAHEFLVDLEISPALGSIKKHVESLGASVERLGTHAVDQDENQRAFRAAATEAQALARSLRVEFMRPIARISQTLFPDDAPLREALRMPRAQNYEGLIAAALSMAGRAAEHKDKFVAAGFDEDFVDRLKKAATTLREALDAKNAFYGKRSAATRGVMSELSRGRQMVRILDDMVASGLRMAPERLARWKTLSRFVRSSSPEQAPDAGTPAPVPAPTPAPAPAAIPTPTPPNATAVEGGPIARAA